MRSKVDNSVGGVNNTPTIHKLRKMSTHKSKLTQAFLFITASLLFLSGSAGSEDLYDDLSTILMRSTFKMEGKDKNNKTVTGTVFLLGKPTREGSEYSYLVLITATHILDAMDGEMAILSLRTKRGASYEKLPYKIFIRKGEREFWASHPVADVSAMYVKFPKGIDVAVLNMDYLADEERLKELDLHPGDELLCLGYPLSAEANEAGFPILRGGKIASFPIVPIKDYHSFVFDFDMFPGNSGGPVYFVRTDRMSEGGGQPVQRTQAVVGMVTEEIIEGEAVGQGDEITVRDRPLALARVVHASIIRETIELLPER